MKNWISLLVAAALILSVFAGCTRPVEPPTETTAPTETVPPTEPVIPLELPGDQRPYVGVQLRFLSLLTGEDPRAAVLEQAAEAFAIRTGAQVQFTWLDGDQEALLAMMGQGDIFSVSLDALDHQVGAKALDLTGMAEAAGYDEHSYPVLRDQIRERCGYLAGIAQEPRVYGMFYNADAFRESGVAEYPDSWEDFLALSAQLTENGYMPLTIDMENAHLILELHLERHLGYEELIKRMKEAGWTRKAEYAEVFRLAIQYAEQGYLAKGDPAVFPAGQDKLALSNVAMVAGSNDLCGQVERSTMMDVNWGVFPYPGDGPGKGYAVESQVLAVNAECANPQAAFDFVMLVTTGAFDQLYADVCEGIPADPVNESGIEGAAALLAGADTRGMGVLSDRNMELFTRLWNGWYKTPGYFAVAMNGLAGQYSEDSGQGVG